jgi:hypothetical protein
MMLYANLGLRTNLRRWNVVNRVYVCKVDHPVDLARMHAHGGGETFYDPNLFPGLFYTTEIVYKDRQDYNSKVSGNAHGRTELVKSDLALLKRPNAAAAAAADSGCPLPPIVGLGNLLLAPAGPRDSSGAEENPLDAQLHSLFSGGLRDEVQLTPALIEKFLPPRKELTALVFDTGKIVVLGIDHVAEGALVFKRVIDKCNEFSISEEQQQRDKERAKAEKAKLPPGARAKRISKQQQQQAMRANANSTRLSAHLNVQITQMNETVRDPAERQARLAQLLNEEGAVAADTNTEAPAATGRRGAGKRGRGRGGGGGGADGPALDEIEEWAALLEGQLEDEAVYEEAPAPAAAARNNDKEPAQTNDDLAFLTSLLSDMPELEVG